MRAAVLTELGLPDAGDFDEPRPGEGQAVLEVAVAGLNPVDVTTAAGTFHGGPPPLPSVCGKEAVGTLEGRRVYVGAAIAPWGTMAERALVDPAEAIPLPDGLADEQAVAFGVAGLAGWLAVEWRARLQPGETVLVLGASGTVGLIAVQAAKLLGAGRVVAAARSKRGLERARAAGADAAVALGAGDDLAAAFRAAAERDIDVVIDPLWGEPAVAAIAAAGPGARFVQLGQSAGTHAALPSAAIRGKLLSVLGLSNFGVPADVKRAAYERMAAHGAAGELAVDVERVPLAEVRSAFERQRDSPGVKLVVVP
ncbi:MAG TPA: zinc-binding alcohol dehydrogenase family protein [Solirubrobacteraceae bacterium]|jgi:NADPH2:quinone reductase